MSKWFYFNIILFVVVIWQVASHFSFPQLIPTVLFGFIGFLFYLFNWTRNAVFSTIRNVPNRQTKIKLANMSKKIMPYHRWTGTSALVFIFIHVYFVIDRYSFTFQSPKMMVGLLALLNLMTLVTTGWLRLVRPTGKLRKIHLGLGMSLFLFIAFHVLL